MGNARGKRIRTALHAVALAFVLAAAARAELDLTPIASTYELEGMRFQNVFFRDDPGIVTYTPPSGWYWAGGWNRFSLRSTGRSPAEASVTKVPRRDPGPLTEEGIAGLKALALGLAPRGSTKINLVSSEQNVLRIGRRDTFEFTIDYVFFGQQSRMNVLFFQRGDFLMQCVLVAVRADYSEMHKQFSGSLYSWQDNASAPRVGQTVVSTAAGN